MQISLKALRELGFLKITDIEFPFDDIVQLDLENRDIEVKLWGYMENHSKNENRYDGINNLVGYCGWIASERNKRKFSNTWKSIWSQYTQAIRIRQSCSSTVPTEVLLSDFGLRLAKLGYKDATVDRVVKFYNDVINWYLFTSTDFDEQEVLRLLVLQDLDSLRGYMRNGILNN